MNNIHKMIYAPVYNMSTQDYNIYSRLGLNVLNIITNSTIRKDNNNFLITI